MKKEFPPIAYSKQWLKSILRHFDLAITGYKNLQVLYERSSQLERVSQKFDDMAFLRGLPNDLAKEIFSLMRLSRSQIRQDLFVLSEISLKKNGYFVEFGATNGVDLSNTWLLEKHFGWRGIVAEPAKVWHSSVSSNRICHIEKNCVWSRTGETIIFNEAANPDMSTINDFSSQDHHAKARINGEIYEVRTISLNDMLDKFSAPSCIDYLSIDTEGSEYEILKNCDFGKYRFRVITCEHNYGQTRGLIHDLLSSKGYKRKLEELSLFDDWYVLETDTK